MSKITHNGNELEHTLHRYRMGGSAIQLWQDGESYTMATAWVEGLEEDEIAIKDYSENTGIYEALLEADIITPAHRFIPSGYVILPVCYLRKDLI